MRRGLFITLEGGEGAGKSTLQKRLVERLSSNNRKVVSTREPGGTPYAEAIRECVLHPPGEAPWTPMAEALLMNAARSEHISSLIEPALIRGEIVLCDRFIDSTRVYQAVQSGVTPSDLLALEALVVGETRPDVTLILDADPAALVGRRRRRGESADTFERRDASFHEAVRRGFREIAEAEPDRCVVIDASQSEDAVLAQALDAIQPRLGR
ncbi:MAG: dTMP kinase [Pseudomonadota bacterium]